MQRPPCCLFCIMTSVGAFRRVGQVAAHAISADLYCKQLLGLPGCLPCEHVWLAANQVKAHMVPGHAKHISLPSHRLWQHLTAAVHLVPREVRMGVRRSASCSAMSAAYLRDSMTRLLDRAVLKCPTCIAWLVTQQQEFVEVCSGLSKLSGRL